ncbi:unnamed protein product [Arabis nemorensis]|uniref:Eukaryotic translation initiation factor 3 subunit E N-terminal domain-containing protein n=1 Tax=Arabis nemorensis TaxID=586526 RepID=A0A565BN74_9BRAS|nr:unnamed protein product [Arabis nemorensis]
MTQSKENYDLTPLVAPNLDRHLVFPMSRILKFKIELLNQTNMVDYAMDIHKSLYNTEDAPKDMVERRLEVVARLKSLEEAAAPLVSFLLNENAVKELRADKKNNLHICLKSDNNLHICLKSDIRCIQIGPDQIEAFFVSVC